MNGLSALLHHSVAVLRAMAILTGQRLVAQTEPTLVVQPSGIAQVQLVWSPGANFEVLEESPALDPFDEWREVSQAPSVFGPYYSVRLDATNGSSFYRLATRGTPGMATPPDPATTAPALAPNRFNDHAASTAFLYTGANAVQTGVATGIISPVLASVLRGKVKRRDNSPLPGVRLALLNHPEFGYTLTRADGRFELAVIRTTICPSCSLAQVGAV